MKPRISFAAGAGLLALALSVGGGCGSEAPHGSPVLLRVYWEVVGQDPITIWSKGGDPDAVSTVPPGPKRFDLIFDRVIDGSKIEDTLDGGVGQAPKTDPPVAVQWFSLPGTVGPSIKIDVWYNSIPFTFIPVDTTKAPQVEVPGTSYIFANEQPAYPAGASLSILLDRANITSKYNEPMTGPDVITVATELFMMTSPAPSTPILLNHWVPLQFNTRPADVSVLAAFVHVTAGGAPVAFALAEEPLDPRLIYVQPAAGAIWPSGIPVEVTVDPALPDRFGATLGGAPATIGFTPCSSGAEKGGVCTPDETPDAGTTPDAVDTDAGAVIDATVDDGAITAD